LFKDSIK